MTRPLLSAVLLLLALPAAPPASQPPAPSGTDASRPAQRAGTPAKATPRKTDPALTLPDQVTGNPGDFITIKATTTGDVVRWVVLDEGLRLFPPDLLKDTKTAVVISAQAGSYRLLAYTSVGNVPSDPAICKVTVGTPPPPPPTDPFTKAVLAAYAADADSAKAQRVQLLAALYETAATGTSNGVMDPNIKDTAALLAVMQAARKNLMPDDAILGVRRAIEAELNKTLSKPMTLDDATRKQLAALFTRVGAALGGLK